MSKKLLFIFTLIFIAIFFLFPNISFSKYIFENTFLIANININIDTQKPIIELINVNNTNIGYEKYANKTHTITAKIKILENNLKINNINKDTIVIYLDDKIIKPIIKEISLVSDNENEKVYDITLTNIIGNGALKIYFPPGVLVDNNRSNK